MGRTTNPPGIDTTFERLPNEGDEAWNAFKIYRDMGERVPGQAGGRSIENVRISLGKDESYGRNLRGWSVKYDWGRRARKYDDELERKNRVVAEAKLPYWAKMRERSHRLNMKLARDIRKKIQEMLKHPITVEEVKDINGREVVFVMPARWTYNTVGNLSKIAAELEAGTIADATMSMLEEDTFDPQAASIEELRDYIQRHSPRKGRVTE
jgi:hypothetical protein